MKNQFRPSKTVGVQPVARRAVLNHRALVSTKALTNADGDPAAKRKAIS